MSIGLSIILCSSRERLPYLRACLASLATPLAASEAPVELILVDHSAEGQALQPATDLAGLPPQLICAVGRVGCSQSRNTGAALATQPWLLFLDDDTFVPPSFLAQARALCAHSGCDSVGGTYYPWYPHGKPTWLTDDVGRKAALAKVLPEMLSPRRDGYLSAGIMLIRRPVFLDCGGFPLDFGMGVQPGYGEENHLQDRLVAAGYTLGFSPRWYMYHAVSGSKLTPRWQLRLAYARARDGQRLYRTHALTTIVGKLLWVSLTGVVWRGPRLLLRWLLVPSYSRQGAWLHWAEPWARWLGYWAGWHRAS